MEQHDAPPTHTPGKATPHHLHVSNPQNCKPENRKTKPRHPPRDHIHGHVSHTGNHLLRVGEYTYHRPSDKRRTKHFTRQDIALWSNTTLLPHTLPEKQLRTTCTSATLRIANQKTGKRNQGIHQETTFTDTCPIQAIISRVKTILNHDPSPQTCISTYYPRAHPKGRILGAPDISAAIKTAVVTMGLHAHGLTPNQVSSHSLRAGGAMAMHLNGVPHDTIKKMGRWSSDTFLLYIHEQIAMFSHNVSTQMSKTVPFHNIHFQRTPSPSIITVVA